MIRAVQGEILYVTGIKGDNTFLQTWKDDMVRIVQGVKN